jgi:hypothetical protein
MDASRDWMTTARRIWLWPVSILVGFPIGGYVAAIVVDGVDSVGAAIVAGVIAGVISERRNGSHCAGGSRGSGFQRRLRGWRWA